MFILMGLSSAIQNNSLELLIFGLLSDKQESLTSRLSCCVLTCSAAGVLWTPPVLVYKGSNSPYWVTLQHMKIKEKVFIIIITYLI